MSTDLAARIAALLILVACYIAVFAAATVEVVGA